MRNEESGGLGEGCNGVGWNEVKLRGANELGWKGFGMGGEDDGEWGEGTEGGGAKSSIAVTKTPFKDAQKSTKNVSNTEARNASL